MSKTGIALTEAAATRVREFIERDGGEGLRVGVRRTGCSGWAYVVELAPQAGAGDEVFHDHGLSIFVDRDALPMLAGTTVDYVQHGLNATFEFDNPNVTDECGCGESFTISNAA
ncbi:MAG: iron-sulfur cluster assembly accessory protein [Wenzhouxiangellaceae bacterium]|nr:iron-sulfur cluster assembly accessory protein [Wenzhouxiangellaceae bacterium]